MKHKEKKYAVVLSGGAFLGAYQLGALNYITEHWGDITGSKSAPVFDIVSGISVGSLNGALLAQQKMTLLNQLWQSVAENGSKEIFLSDYVSDSGEIKLNFEALKSSLFPDFKVRFSYLLRALGNWFTRPFKRDEKLPGLFEIIIREIAAEANKNLNNFTALADNKPLNNKLTQSIRLADFPENCTYQCGFVSLNSGTFISADNKQITDDKTLINCILASASIPVMWAPVPQIHYRGTHINLADGGLKNVSPLADAVEAAKADADYDYRFIIINCHTFKPKPHENEKWNILNAAARSLELIMSEIFNNDIHSFIKKNILATKETMQRDNGLKSFEYKLIQPDIPNLGNALCAEKEVIRQRIQKGFRQAEEVFQSEWNIS